MSSVSDVQGWSYAIFDPTYYIEMLHVEDVSITVEGDLAQNEVLGLSSPTRRLMLLPFLNRPHWITMPMTL